MAAGPATGAAPGLPADRWGGEITAPLPSLAALLDRAERLLIVAVVVADAQSAAEPARRGAGQRACARRPRPDVDTSKYLGIK
jgi:hypothetical protein